MHRRVYRISIALQAAWILAAIPTSAADRSAADKHADRWIPSWALVFGFTAQEMEGEVSSQEVGGGPLRPSADNEKTLISPQVGGSLELLTPELPLPLHPRLFIGGEILNVSNQKRDLAGEGDPTGVREPDDLVTFPAEAILGLGSEVVADLDNVLYGASVGFSIPMKIGDWQVSVKPSVRYVYREVDFTGRVVEAFRPTPLGPTRSVDLSGQDSLDTHAVGPGLEIEVEAVRIKSLAASLYVGGGAYRVLSDRRVKFSDTAVDSAGLITYQANWGAEIDAWLYRADVGFRIKWLGLPSGWLGGGSGK